MGMHIRFSFSNNNNDDGLVVETWSNTRNRTSIKHNIWCIPITLYVNETCRTVNLINVI